MIESLKAGPGIPSGRHVNEGKQYARDKLQDEHGEGGAAEDIKPARSLAGNRVLGGLANRRAQLQPEIKPFGDFLDQAHVAAPPFWLAARPGVGISPALMKSCPFSSL